MWIPKKDDWENKHTDLTKFFIEKVKQQVDSQEIISNKHKTTNGFTIIGEIIEVGKLVKFRKRTINRLVSLLEEAKCQEIYTSIINDYIIKNYHTDIIDYYKKLDIGKLKKNEFDINNLILDSQIFYRRLKDEYSDNLENEFSKIDFDSNKFDRYSNKIVKLVSCLIPYLLEIGYSTTSIDEISYRYIFNKKVGNIGKRFINLFSGSERECKILIKCEKGCEVSEHIKSVIKKNNTTLKNVDPKSISEYTEKEKITKRDGEELIEFNVDTIDPQNYIRDIYDTSLKEYVSQKDKLTLSPFNDFFKRIYWRFRRRTGMSVHKYQKADILLDPINVPNRRSTLFETLKRISRDEHYGFEFDDNSVLPSIPELKDSIYYYNLAIGSKSIENSLFLLWTSLESLLPYRKHETDIESVQYFVSNSLSFGTIGRELFSFLSRYVETSRLHDDCFDGLNGMYAKFFSNSPSGMKKWADWLCTEFKESDDPYYTIKEYSNLLCKQFRFLNELYTGKHKECNTVIYWLDKINKSKKSIHYQLDRIYLHRNQIVHSGKFINEYSNLWAHLEWYIGKLLTYGVIKYYEEPDNFKKENAYLQLESDSRSILNLLNSKKDMRIFELSDEFHRIFKHVWQFF